MAQLRMDNPASSSDSSLLTPSRLSPPKVPPKASTKPRPASGGSQTPAAVTSDAKFSRVGAIVVDGAEILPTSVGVSGLTAAPARLEQEPDVMFDRFAWWCTAPERGERRSWAAVAERYAVDAATVRAQARRYDWLTRSIEWDRKRVLGAAQKATALQASTAVSHVSLAQELTDQAHRALRACDELLDGEVDLAVMDAWQRTASGISKILEKSQKAARLALGQSESNVSVKVETKKAADELDLDRLSYPELRLLTLCEQLRLTRMDGNGCGQLPGDVQALLTLIEERGL